MKGPECGFKSLEDTAMAQSKNDDDLNWVGTGAQRKIGFQRY